MNSQNIIDTLNQIIDKQDISVASVARRMGKSSQTLNQQLNNNEQIERQRKNINYDIYRKRY